MDRAKSGVGEGQRNHRAVAMLRDCMMNSATTFVPSPGTGAVDLIVGGWTGDRKHFRRAYSEVEPSMALSMRVFAEQPWASGHRAFRGDFSRGYSSPGLGRGEARGCRQDLGGFETHQLHQVVRRANPTLLEVHFFQSAQQELAEVHHGLEHRERRLRHMGAALILGEALFAFHPPRHLLAM